MKTLIAILVLLGCYGAIINPFVTQLENRPLLAKVGYIPQGSVMRFASADQKQLMASYLVLKVLTYFGVGSEDVQKRVGQEIDYSGMSKIIESTIQLDPYNMDAYYFNQAILVWDLKQYEKAIELLDYGMKYRDWDHYLPFFAGFNSAYFLKDYEKAAQYYKRAGELTGAELFQQLTSRYLHQTGQTGLAIAYLSTIKNTARSKSIRKRLSERLLAFEGVYKIEQALQIFVRETGKRDVNVEGLVRVGHLTEVPVDPYGGEYYIDEDGSVTSTSNFNRNRLRKKK